MKNATENEEFDTMVRILKRNDLCTMESGLFKNDAVFCKIGHSVVFVPGNKANRPTMRPRWAVWRLVVVTMAAMMVVML